VAHIRLIDVEDATGALAEEYEAAVGRAGRVFNIVRAMSLRPGVLRASMALYREIMFGPSQLSRQERELLAVVVSNANACAYWTRAHADDLRDEGAADWAEHAAHDYRRAELPSRTRALCDFALALTHAPAATERTAIDRLRAEGLDDEAIHDAIQVIAYFNYVNRVADGVGIGPEPDWRWQACKRPAAVVRSAVQMARPAFRAGLAAVATLSALGVVATATGFQHARAHGGGCRAAPAGTGAASADEVQRRFVETAVVRRYEVCSYDLVTAFMHAGLTRADWATGNIPVQPFATSDPAGVVTRFRPHEDRARLRASYVELESADLGRATFEVVVVARGGRWLVAYWAPTPRIATPTPQG
jgi:uncharacterized peroxidase-related enzyme